MSERSHDQRFFSMADSFLKWNETTSSIFIGGGVKKRNIKHISCENGLIMPWTLDFIHPETWMQPAYAERLEPILKASKVLLFSICFREVFSHYFLVGKGGIKPWNWMDSLGIRVGTNITKKRFQGKNVNKGKNKKNWGIHALTMGREEAFYCRDTQLRFFKSSRSIIL